VRPLFQLPEYRFREVSARGLEWLQVGSRQCIDPRVEQGGMGRRVVPRFARHDGQSVLQGRCCDDQIRLRIGMTKSAAFLYEQTPFEHHIFADGQYTLFKHRADFVHQPVVEFGAPVRVGK